MSIVPIEDAWDWYGIFTLHENHQKQANEGKDDIHEWILWGRCPQMVPSVCRPFCWDSTPRRHSRRPWFSAAEHLDDMG